MKKTFLIILACGMIAGCASTGKSKYKSVNENEVPEKYTRDFHKRRADVEQVNWQMVDSNCYIASFNSNNNQVSMKFNNTNVETRWNVPLEYTPSNITEYISTQYVDFKIEEVNILEIRNKKTYRVDISKKKESKLLEFDLLGKFVKEVENL
ncbi:MAG: hypothetical protein IIX43_01855 [Bacteroidales bacterium]|nr:hypothetical protein [Bacteroidales bacterium]